MALNADETALLDKLQRQWQDSQHEDERLLRYYMGRQRVEQLGMAIPPAMRRFLVVTNWCRVVVDTIRDRQQLRWMMLPGEDTADPRLRAISDASNLDAHLALFNQDRMIYGRAYMSVGSNEDDPELPLIRAESPREMTALVDVRRERIQAAGRFYGSDDETGEGPLYATLYLPDETVWLQRDRGRWVEIDRDRHRLGRVPIVMHLNRRMSGSWSGESQIADMIYLVDAAARSLTNMQFAQEAHGVPDKYLTGVDAGDFKDENGKPIPRFEAYFNALKLVKNPQAKVGSIDAADLKNFETALDVYGRQASIVTGFPARYFGLHTANPPAEGAILADEITLVRSIEYQNLQVGVSLGWVGGLALRFATGDWVDGNRVRAEWYDPATPTVQQRMDALVKQRQVQALSRRGLWTEMGWSEARMEREEAWLAAEAEDPVIDRLLRDVTSEVGGDAGLGV